MVDSQVYWVSEELLREIEGRLQTVFHGVYGGDRDRVKVATVELLEFLQKIRKQEVSK